MEVVVLTDKMIRPLDMSPVAMKFIKKKTGFTDVFVSNLLGEKVLHNFSLVNGANISLNLINCLNAGT